MKQQADINRVKRAIEHLKMARTNLNSIKMDNMDVGDPSIIITAKYDIEFMEIKLKRLIGEK